MTRASNSKTSLTGDVYKYFFQSILEKDKGIDAELLTQLAIGVIRQTSIHRDLPGLNWLLNELGKDLKREDSRLEQKIFGCHFQNPIGLAAGFDKNGVGAGIWDRFGFGFAEVGTVTWHPQEGNPRPRLFRLAAEQAALNRMGFNNEGAAVMQQTLEKQFLAEPGQRPCILGINLGKSKITSLEKAPTDYSLSLKLLSEIADYAVINVSSPNTEGLRNLQSSKRLRQLIEHLKDLPKCPPLLVKIAPDLNNQEIDELANVALEAKLAGLIAVNTSVDRLGLEQRVLPQTGKVLLEEAGGLSGAPLQERALEVIRRLHRICNKELPLIGVGGVDSPQAAWDRISAGASLVQIYTGWIFQGPSLVPRILEGLVSQIERHKFKNISDAVGTNAPWI